MAQGGFDLINPLLGIDTSWSWMSNFSVNDSELVDFRKDEGELTAEASAGATAEKGGKREELLFRMNGSRLQNNLKYDETMIDMNNVKRGTFVLFKLNHLTFE